MSSTLIKLVPQELIFHYVINVFSLFIRCSDVSGYLVIHLQAVASCKQFRCESWVANAVNGMKQIYELHFSTSTGMCEVRYWRLVPWSVGKRFELCKSQLCDPFYKIQIRLAHMLLKCKFTFAQGDVYSHMRVKWLHCRALCVIYYPRCFFNSHGNLKKHIHAQTRKQIPSYDIQNTTKERKLEDEGGSMTVEAKILCVCMCVCVCVCGGGGGFLLQRMALIFSDRLPGEDRMWRGQKGEVGEHSDVKECSES